MLYFAQDFIEFRYPEIRSIIKLFNLDIKLPAEHKKPFWILQDVSESDLRKIASRSVSLRFVFELYSSGNSYAIFHENLKKFSATMDEKISSSNESFRITVESFNRHYKQAEKIDLIESMDYLPLKGKIDLKNPDNNFIYFEYWELDRNGKIGTVEPEEILFGRWVSRSSSMTR